MRQRRYGERSGLAPPVSAPSRPPYPRLSSRTPRHGPAIGSCGWFEGGASLAFHQFDPDAQEVLAKGREIPRRQRQAGQRSRSQPTSNIEGSIPHCRPRTTEVALRRFFRAHTIGPV